MLSRRCHGLCLRRTMMQLCSSGFIATMQFIRMPRYCTRGLCWMSGRGCGNSWPRDGHGMLPAFGGRFWKYSIALPRQTSSTIWLQVSRRSGQSLGPNLTAFDAARDAEGSKCRLSAPTAALQSLFGPVLLRHRLGTLARAAFRLSRWPGLLPACGRPTSSRTMGRPWWQVAEQTHPRAVSSAELWVLRRLWHNGQGRWQEPGFPAVPSCAGSSGSRDGRAPGSMSELRGSLSFGLPALFLSGLSRLPVVLQQALLIATVPVLWSRIWLRLRLGGDLREQPALSGEGRSVTASPPSFSYVWRIFLPWAYMKGGRRSVTVVSFLFPSLESWPTFAIPEVSAGSGRVASGLMGAPGRVCFFGISFLGFVLSFSC